jgi:hypothetical protein
VVSARLADDDDGQIERRARDAERYVAEVWLAGRAPTVWINRAAEQYIDYDILYDDVAYDVKSCLRHHEWVIGGSTRPTTRAIVVLIDDDGTAQVIGSVAVQQWTRVVPWEGARECWAVHRDDLAEVWP